jgi:hypothetical protein
MNIGTDRVPGPVAVVLVLLFMGFAYFGFIGGETTRWLMLLCFAVAFILIVIVSLVDKATAGAGPSMVVHSGAGAGSWTPGMSDHRSEEAPREVVLTPSEIVYLEGDRFAPPGGTFSGYRLAGSGASVSKRELAQQVYAAAFLAAEKAGALHLAVRPKQTLLGLRTVQALYADPTDRTGPCPQHSLERCLPSLAWSQNEVWRILHDLIPESADPYAQAVHLVGSDLADRGLLEVSRSKRLGVFTKTEVHLPERTKSLAAGRVSEVQSLLHECRQARPELWEMLIANIDKGIRSRQQQQDYGPSM